MAGKEREMVAKAIKFVYEKSGSDSMERNDFIQSISTDQHWLSPEDAANFLDNSIRRGLIYESQDGLLSPSEEVMAAPLPPLAFTPDEDSLKEWARRSDSLQSALSAVMEQTGMTKRDIMAEANRIKTRLNVDIRVAILIVGMRQGLDVSALADEVEQDLIERRINEEENA